MIHLNKKTNKQLGNLTDYYDDCSQELAGKENDKHEPTIYTVTEVTNRIKLILEKNSLLRYIRVSGEVSNINFHSSGNVYFSIKDEESLLDCIMFRTEARLIQFKPEQGMHVIVQGSISVYKPRGAYRLIATSIEPKGLGSLYLEFLKLKERLRAEGLFEAARKKPIPRYPGTIGIVTSPTGSVVRDIRNVISRRYPCVKVIVAPALVQGAGAAETLISALRLLNRIDEVDVIIIARGGGSLEDLWEFNSENLARAIAASKKPVIAAVGHETDFTIADFVADLRAPTPSAAAELAVPTSLELLDRLTSLKQLFVRGTISIIVEKKQQVDDLGSGLLKETANRIEHLRKEVRALSGRLEALNPKEVLRRGFSILSSKGRVITSSKQTDKGAEVDATLAEGRLKLNVKEVIG